MSKKYDGIALVLTVLLAPFIGKGLLGLELDRTVLSQMVIVAFILFTFLVFRVITSFLLNLNRN
ncbi:hypothetical protein ACFQ2J_09900 [Thalassobacillus hwangdonensis]|uniref:Uncharacterized protein n=1 Tax=Thalassobacillus hwangdonensis TaxID=546108 RepID=A0ABW3L294_9BACI